MTVGAGPPPAHGARRGSGRGRPWALAGLLALLVVLWGSGTGHWAGWVLMYLAVVLVIRDPQVQADRALLAGLLAVLALREAAALWNVFVAPLPAVNPDAATFHDNATKLGSSMGEPDWSVGAPFFEAVLRSMYPFGNGSLLFAEQLSVLAGLGACLLMVRVMGQLGITHGRAAAVVGSAILPSAMLFGSVVLREPFELLLFVAAVYFVLQVRPGRWLAPAGAALAALGLMGMLHQVLFFWGAGAVILFTAWFAWERHAAAGGRIWPVLAIGAAALAVVVLVLVIAPANLGNNYLLMAGDGLARALTNYRAAVDAGAPASSYHLVFDASSSAALAGSLLNNYVHYLFAPFPWQVDSWKDLYAAAEGLLRLGLIGLAALWVWRASPQTRRAALLLVGLYLSMTVVWSLGTTNYGQAVRHHTLSNWILFVLGVGGGWVLLARRRAGRS